MVERCPDITLSYYQMYVCKYTLIFIHAGMCHEGSKNAVYILGLNPAIEHFPNLFYIFMRGMYIKTICSHPTSQNYTMYTSITVVMCTEQHFHLNSLGEDLHCLYVYLVQVCRPLSDNDADSTAAGVATLWEPPSAFCFTRCRVQVMPP